TSVTWEGIFAAPDSVLVGVSGATGDLPYLVIGVDSSGKQRWQHGFTDPRDVLLTTSALVIIDHAAKRVVGLDPRTGGQKWSVPDIKDQYGNTADAIYYVFGNADIGGPSTFLGQPAGPISDNRIVELSGDSSARVIDTASGSVN